MSENTNLFNLNGKVAIITGASKGIGASMAKLLADNGASVVVSSRNQEGVDAIANEINTAGNKAIGIACHVGKEDQLKNLVDKTNEAFGGVDILINNAATNPVYGPMNEVTGDLFDKIMGVNVKSPFLLSNMVLPIMKERGGGSIINIASVEGLKPGLGLGVYSVSKGSLIMLTQNQAREWGNFSIRANVICPGLIKTKFSQSLWTNDSLMGFITKQLPLGRIGQPDEMAGLALFLASDASSYCTGGVFTADGGYMLT
jgi:NAD(P)-dependent dehydrogenase (short-subunit alcohol dehydrogenase family)